MKGDGGILLMLVLAGGCCCGLRPVHAQPQEPPPGAPGVWHRGTFLGYVPAHLKSQARTAQPVGKPSASTVAPSTSISKVKPAAASAPYVEPPQNEFPVVAEPEVAEFVEVPGSEPLMCAAGSACCNPAWIWGRAEYLLWWTEGMEVPALATTSPDGTARDQAGVADAPGTDVLFGGAGINDEVRSGGRFTLGMWCDPCRCQGFHVTYLGLGEKTDSFSADDRTASIVARPFFNTESDAQDARLIVFPDVVEGDLSVLASTEFQTLELILQTAVVRVCGVDVDCLLGYRYADLKDVLRVEERTLSLETTTLGSRIQLWDQFDTQNDFHGAQFGFAWRWHPDPCWSWEALAKLALGNVRSQAVVAGATTTATGDGQTTETQGGLLTQGSNIGSYSRSHFGALSECGLTLRRRLSCNLAASFGYTLILWSEVVRAGDQIDMSINTSQVPPGELAGNPRPAFPMADTRFWAQGLHFGLDWRY